MPSNRHAFIERHGAKIELGLWIMLHVLLLMLLIPVVLGVAQS